MDEHQTSLLRVDKVPMKRAAFPKGKSYAPSHLGNLLPLNLPLVTIYHQEAVRLRGLVQAASNTFLGEKWAVRRQCSLIVSKLKKCASE